MSPADLITIENNLIELNGRLSNISLEVAQNRVLQQQIYIAILFIIGTCAAVGVLLLLYKFLRKFF